MTIKEFYKKNKEKFINLLFVFLKVIGKIGSVSTKVIKVVLLGTSFAAYSYLFSWQFALIILVQLIIHEYGHIWAMKKVLFRRVKL